MIFKSQKRRAAWGFSLFYKELSNQIEYANPTDILYSIIIDNEFFQIEVDNSNWEDRVTLGKGYSYGIESFVEKEIGAWKFKLNYTYSRSFRKFQNIDSGEKFPYRYDRPHNIFAQLKYKFNPQSNIIAYFSYGSGVAYSLSNIERLGPNGERIWVPTSRNNFRLLDYHHLDIYYSLNKELSNGAALTWDFGIYNIYNRLNSFYEYFTQEESTSEPELFKISIYPILPQFNLTYSW